MERKWEIDINPLLRVPGSKYWRFTFPCVVYNGDKVTVCSICNKLQNCLLDIQDTKLVCSKSVLPLFFNIWGFLFCVLCTASEKIQENTNWILKKMQTYFTTFFLFHVLSNNCNNCVIVYCSIFRKITNFILLNLFSPLFLKIQTEKVFLLFFGVQHKWEMISWKIKEIF